MLYNKYRPSNLKEVKGQQHILEIIKNIDRKNMPHSALFIGPKGTGKTTVARIWSKLLNCLNPTEDGPCGVCEHCKSIDTGYAIDVIEIDAASNNGVDHIRKLNETVKIKSILPNRVIIIDEIHRLTKEGFDAFLKLFEEPPENVYFVGCTTEFYKIPETIRSRGVKYYFRNIHIDEIANHLEFICKEEGFEYQFDALFDIAKYAKGGLRDAISALELVCVNPITVENVRGTLGILPEEEIFSFISSIFKCDICSSIEKIDYLEELGIVNVIIESVLNMIVDLLTLMNNGDIYNTKEYIIMLQELLQTFNNNFSNTELFNICEVFSNIRGFDTDALSIKCSTIKVIKTLSKKKIELEEENNLKIEIECLKKKITKVESQLSTKLGVRKVDECAKEYNNQHHYEIGQEVDCQEDIKAFDNTDIDINDDVKSLNSNNNIIKKHNDEDKTTNANTSENVVKTKVMSINTIGIRYHNTDVPDKTIINDIKESNKQVNEDKVDDSTYKNDIFASIFGN